MFNMNKGHTVAANITNRKTIRLKSWLIIYLYAQTNFHGWLKMTANLKSSPFSSFSSGFRKILLLSDVKVPRQTEHDRVEQFKHYMQKWMSYFDLIFQLHRSFDE